MKTLVTPSILSANLGKLQEEVDSVSSADWLQVDVMDGHFVPNLSFGAPVVRWIKTKLPLDIHLMVSNPYERIEEFLELKVHSLTFHAEAVEETNSRRALIEAIRKGHAQAGIALKPHTPLSAIEDLVDDIDIVLIMSVEPGFGGQDFLDSVLPKVRELRERFPKLMIQMDGGIHQETAELCRDAGANNLVAGSYIFSSSDREHAIRTLRG